MGKISFDEKRLRENAACVIEALNEARPQSIKGKFIKSLFISSTMNPGLEIAI